MLAAILKLIIQLFKSNNIKIIKLYLQYWHWDPLYAWGHWQRFDGRQLPPFWQGGSQTAIKKKYGSFTNIEYNI